tara:strand:- start:1769 stop:2380 length:612 start_codon:yes stop_codon:yes gene_type:complete
MRDHWDKRYLENEAAYGQLPNRFFYTALTELKNEMKFEERTILLPCDGEGRNALFAAKMGLKTTSFDKSEIGVSKSLQWAKNSGLEVTSSCEDAFQYTPQDKFDIVCLIFAHMPETRRKEFHNLALDWLKPGGIFMLEGFHKNQLGLHSGGPKKTEMLFDEEMLLHDFSQLNIRSMVKVNQNLDEGPFHQGPAVTLQLIAEKL